MNKKLSIVIVLALCSCLSGCYDLTDIENTSTVLAIGVDKSEDNINTFTFAIADVSDKDKGAQAPVECETANADSITNAACQLEKKTSRHLSFTHVQCIAIAENAAGFLKNSVEEMYSNLNINSTSNVIFTRSGAGEYLDKINDLCENSPEMYLRNIFTDNRYLPDFNLGRVYSSVAAGKSFVSPSISIKDDNEEYASAVFSNGEITNIESEELLNAYCVLTGKLNKITINSDEGYSDVYISSKPKIIFDHKSNTIKVDIRIRCEKQSNKNINFAKAEVKRLADMYFEFDQKHNTDLLDISQESKSSFITQNKWEAYDWHNKYPYMNIKVEVQV